MKRSQIFTKRLFAWKAIFGHSLPGWVPLADSARNWAASSPPPLSTVPGTSKFVSVLRVTGDLVGGLEFEWERREKPRRGVFDLRLHRRDCASSTLSGCSDPSGVLCFPGSDTDHDKMKQPEMGHLEDRGLGHHIGGWINVETGAC